MPMLARAEGDVRAAKAALNARAMAGLEAIAEGTPPDDASDCKESKCMQLSLQAHLLINQCWKAGVFVMARHCNMPPSGHRVGGPTQGRGLKCRLPGSQERH